MHQRQYGLAWVADVQNYLLSTLLEDADICLARVRVVESDASTRLEKAFARWDRKDVFWPVVYRQPSELQPQSLHQVVANVEASRFRRTAKKDIRYRPIDIHLAFRLGEKSRRGAVCLQLRPQLLR